MPRVKGRQSTQSSGLRILCIQGAHIQMKHPSLENILKNTQSRPQKNRKENYKDCPKMFAFIPLPRQNTHDLKHPVPSKSVGKQRNRFSFSGQFERREEKRERERTNPT